MVDDCTEASCLASPGVSFFPKLLKRLELPGVLPSGFGASETGAAGLNRFGAEDPDVAAGFAAPKRDAPDVASFWEPSPPKRLLPGGGPAGVVEGRDSVLFGAGVAAGVEDPVTQSVLCYQEASTGRCVSLPVADGNVKAGAVVAVVLPVSAPALDAPPVVPNRLGEPAGFDAPPPPRLNAKGLPAG